MAGSNRKKKRAHKTSKGIHGGGGEVTLTTVQKALMGKGLVQSFEPSDLGRSRPWAGASPIVRDPWDPEQAAIYAAEEAKNDGRRS